ncbi:hypothetical protein ABG067_005338 [Albugo candida]
MKIIQSCADSITYGVRYQERGRGTRVRVLETLLSCPLYNSSRYLTLQLGFIYIMFSYVFCNALPINLGNVAFPTLCVVSDQFYCNLKRSRRPSSRSSSFRSSSFKPTTIEASTSTDEGTKETQGGQKIIIGMFSLFMISHPTTIEASTSTDEGTKETQGGQKIIIGMFSLFMISHVNAITITLDGDSDIVVRTSNKKVKPPMASIYYNMWPSQAEEQYFIGTRVDLALNVEIGNEILVGTVMSDQAEDRIPTDISLILSDNKFIFPQNTIGSWMYACEREPVTTEEGIKNWLLSNINTPCSVAIVFKDARGNVVFDLLPSSMIDNGNRILSIEDTKVLLSAHQRYTYILGKRLLEFYDLTVSRKSTLTRFFPGIVGNKDKGKEQLRIHFSKKSDPRMPR